MKNTFYKFFFLCLFNFASPKGIRYSLFPIYILSLFAVISNCSVKFAFAEERDRWPEFESRLFYGRDGVSDSRINITSPETIDRDNSIKLGQHNVSKSAGGKIESIPVMNVHGKIDGNECNKKSNQVASVFDKYFIHFIALWSCLVLWPCFFRR